MKKITAIAITMALVLTTAMPVLAKGPGAGQENRTLHSQAQQHQNDQKGGNLEVADQTAPAQEHGKAAEQGKGKGDVNKHLGQLIGPVHQLQAKEISLRNQINALKNQIKTQAQADSAAGNYTALQNALADTATLTADVKSVRDMVKANQADWEQFRADKKAGNVDALKADVEKMTADLQNRIAALQAVLTDLQKVQSDLAQPTPAPITNTGENTTTGDTAVVAPATTTESK